MSTPNISVRTATPADVPAMLVVSDSSQKWAIDNGLATAAEQPPITPARMAWFTKNPKVAQEWSSGTSRLFVGEVDGEIVGWMMASLGYPPHFPDTQLSQVYLSSVYVHVDHMKKGVATTMVAFLKNEAIKERVQVIRAECRLGKLVEYYQAWGFSPVPYTGPIDNYEETHQMLEIDLQQFVTPGINSWQDFD